MRKLSNSNTFLFLLIVLVHVAYKMLYLDAWGFWHDEAFSLYYSQQHWGHIKHISEWDINPPLYYYFLWIWQQVFGIGEYAVRFSSVIFSALAAGMLFLFCTRNFNRLTAWFAVLFYTISFEMYFYAHEARPYSLIMLLVLCSSYCFLELMRKPGWIWALCLALLNFGLIYTHYVSGIILLIQAVIVLAYRSKDILKYFGIAMGVTLLLAVLRFTQKTLALVLNNQKSSFWIEKPTLRDLVDTFYSFFNGPDLFWIFLFAALVVFVQLVRAGEWKGIRTAHKVQFNYVLLGGLGAVVVCFIVSLFLPLFVRRYLLFTAPFIYIGIAWLLSYAEAGIRYPLYAIIGVFACFSTLRIDFRTPRSMDYRNAVAHVKDLQQGATPVLVETPDMAALFSYYYDRSIFQDYGNVNGRLKEKGVHFVANAVDVQNSIDVTQVPRVVLTQTFEEANPGNMELLKVLAANYPNKEINRSFAGITITVYSK